MSSDGSDSQPDRQTEFHATPDLPPVLPPAPLDAAIDLQVVGGLSAPGFLHPSSVIFEAASHIKQYVVPAAFGMFGIASGNLWGLVVAAIVFAVSFAVTLVRYLTLRYRIQGNDFVVTEGLLFRRVRSVPIRRVQNVDLVQNLLHRLFGVAVVNIETASGAKPEATLRVLTLAQVDELRQAIFGDASLVAGDRNSRSSEPNGQSRSEAAGGELGEAAARKLIPADDLQLVWEIPTRMLVLAGLTSNRGLVLLGILVGFFFQGDFDKRFWPRRISTEQISQYVPQQIQSWSVVLQVALGILALLIVLRLVSVAWYILRFYGYKLTRSGDDLRITCGLFTRVSATVPRKRIQFISVHRTLLMRPLGLASIRIETAGGGGGQNEDAAATVSRRWFVPVVRESEVHRILVQLRPAVCWRENEVQWHGLAPRAGQRLFRQAILASLLAAVVGLGITRPWGWSLGLLALPMFTLIARKKARARRYARLPWGIAYHSGVLTRKLSFSFYDRIQTLAYFESPFDRRWGMASLHVDTAAAGPADHLISVDYLDADFARRQFADLQLAAAAHRPSWN